MKIGSYSGFPQLEIMVMVIALTLLPGVYCRSAAADESEDDLLQYLEHTDWTIRLEAIKAVGQQKDGRGLDQILAALKDRHKEIRRAAATALGSIRERRTLDALIGCLKDEDKDVRAAAVTALGVIADPRALKPLSHALNEKYLRARAAWALGSLKTPEALKPLLSLTKDKDRYVRQVAVMSLAQIPDPRTTPALVDIMRTDQDAYIRGRAAAALGEHGDPASVPLPSLIAMLADEDEQVRGWISRSLGKLCKDSPDLLVETLKNGAPLAREGAVQTLGIIKDPGTIEPLLAALKEGDSRIRLATVFALGGFSTPAAIEAIVTALRDRDAVIRSCAARTLGDLKAPQAVEPLMEAARDPIQQVRADAARALGELKDNRGAETLILLLADSDYTVRRSAREALIKIGSPAAAALLATLRSDNMEQKLEAILVLAGIREARAVEPLMAILQNKDRQLSAAAVSALGKIGAPAVGPLQELLLDENGERRHLAVLGLEGTRDYGAVESLARVLGSEKDYQIRSSIIRALGTIGGGRAAAALGGYFLSTPEGRSETMYALKDISRAGASVEAKVLEETSKGCVTGDCHQKEIGAKVIHLAFLLKGCTGCHAGKEGAHPHDEGSEFSWPPGGVKELCFTCHQEIAQKCTGARSVHCPVQEGLCTSCHTPHGSSERALLKRYFPRELYLEYKSEKYELCWGCHEKKMTLSPVIVSLTQFRNGARNLHFLHVNQKKGRSCQVCHDPHAGNQEKLVFNQRHPAGRRLPISFTRTATGGSCVVGCHREMAYDRDQPVTYP